MSAYEGDSDARAVSIEPVALIALDLDGTLLRSDRSICARGAEMLAEAMRLGVRVVLATGRAPRETVRFWRALSLDTPLITHNGALILDGASGEVANVILHRPLDGALARELLRAADAIGPQLALGVEVMDRVYKRSDGLLDRAELFASPVTKVMMAGDTGVLSAVQIELQRRYLGRVGFAYSNMRLLQVTHPRANKAEALAVIADLLGVQQAAVMAIGDAPNDEPMLAWAGVGLAMANGWESVKAAAHFIVPGNDEGGVAYAVQRYALR